MTMTFAPTRIAVPPPDVAMMRRLAEQRWEPKRRRGVENTRRSLLPDWYIDYCGVRGEWAVAQAFDGDFGQIEGSGSRKTFYSITLANGLTVYVSSPTKRGYNFLVKGMRREVFAADLGVLVWPCADYDHLHNEGEEVEVVGWCSVEGFLNQAEVKELGYGPTLVLDHRAMQPLEVVLDKIGLPLSSVFWRQT
jgi:hypothetical protein